MSELTATQQQEQHESWMADSRLHRIVNGARAIMYGAIALAALALAVRLIV
jgi:hypothetical protein